MVHVNNKKRFKVYPTAEELELDQSPGDDECKLSTLTHMFQMERVPEAA